MGRDPAGTVEAVGVRVDEGIEACDGRRLLRPSPAVCGEECFQPAAVHFTGRRGRVLALTTVSCFASTSALGGQVPESLDAQGLGTLAATPAPPAVCAALRAC